MLELLFNVLLQLAIVTGGATGEAKTTVKTQADKATTAKAAPTRTTPPSTGIGSGGWDDND